MSSIPTLFNQNKPTTLLQNCSQILLCRVASFNNSVGFFSKSSLVNLTKKLRNIASIQFEFWPNPYYICVTQTPLFRLCTFYGTEMCSTSFNYQFYESNHLRGIEVLRNILIAAILILEAGFGFIVLHARYSHEGPYL